MSSLRRVASSMVRHATRVLPGEYAAWADAMLNELHYINDDRAAVRWAVGCVIACYAQRLLRVRLLLRPAGAGVLMMLAVVGALEAHAAFVPAFAETACALPDMSADIAARLRCGTVSVPRNYADASAGTFKLAVVVIHPRVQEPQAEPVLFIQGGPGSPLTLHAARIARNESATLAPNRDLILVDQRGAGSSEPAMCPELSRQQLGVFAHEARPDALQAAWRGTYGNCRRELERDGIDPAWFGTSVTVRDLENVRRALGMERWNVYGRSYGTEVAMTLEAQYPDTLRAVVLDSVYPPDPLPLTRSQTYKAALDALFHACRTDASCVAAHPDLAMTFHEAMAGLAKEPLTVALPPGLGSAELVVGPTLFSMAVDQALYYLPFVAMLPKVIQSVHDRDVTALQPFIAFMAREFVSMESPGDAAVVECRDRPSLQAPTVEPTSADGGGIFFRGMCRSWIAPGEPGAIASATKVPTLLLAGEIDPVTPPPFAQMVAEKMGARAHVVAFPHVAHNVEGSSACGGKLVTAFMRDPEAALDTACVGEVKPVAFR
jgi:pimeloyl-ACP methyl ester carboxylesterase